MLDVSRSRLILASTSRYRRDLLARLKLPFDVADPHIEETPMPDEAGSALASRLAITKAVSILQSSQYVSQPNLCVLGSDQVAELDGIVLGKPGGADAARAQLQSMSGRAVAFHTAVCLAHADGRRLNALDTTTVRLRELTSSEIARYIESEQPLDCAGSFKCEGLGIVLFEAIETRDPTALIGLPLIVTAKLLREAGFVLP